MLALSPNSLNLLRSSPMAKDLHSLRAFSRLNFGQRHLRFYSRVPERKKLSWRITPMICDRSIVGHNGTAGSDVAEGNAANEYVPDSLCSIGGGGEVAG